VCELIEKAHFFHLDLYFLKKINVNYNRLFQQVNISAAKNENG
jgi:hypothetical protein